MDMVTHPETELMVATLTRVGRRWMLMLWDGQGEYLRTQWHKTRKEAISELLAHCRAVGAPWPAF
ncbi:hypothetical protein [Zestomonas thermotolerans]|uniref:hypothetical protein n=1 Tax=Zestomonas thermotolerans TaxID=157784 RepID=UPI00036B45A3|nr:hypothetical protein [Pseudomonas thermotolerans]